MDFDHAFPKTVQILHMKFENDLMSVMIMELKIVIW